MFQWGVVVDIHLSVGMVLLFCYDRTFLYSIFTRPGVREFSYYYCDLYIYLIPTYIDCDIIYRVNMNLYSHISFRPFAVTLDYS